VTERSVLCRQLLAVSLATGRIDSIPLAEETFGPGSHVVKAAGRQVWAMPVEEAIGPLPDDSIGADPLVLELSRGIRDQDAAPLSASDLATRLRTGRGMDSVCAPFAAALVDNDAVIVGADHLGLRHVYAVRRPGWAAISTSSALLAQMAGARIDVDVLGVLHSLGHCLGTATPFVGITKLAPGHRWRLADGDLTTISDPLGPDPHVGTEWTPQRASELLRSLVERHLDRNPDTVFELSGGMDSRIIIAAIPPARRPGLRALTLTASGSRELAVAADIAAADRLDHEVVDLSGISSLEPAEAHRRVVEAARLHDCSGNPVNLAMLGWAEQRVAPGFRITGQAGEMMRGVYFLEPRGRRVKAKYVDRFARVWFTGNEAVPQGFLTPGFRASSLAALRDALRASFAEYDMDWRTARDEFLLRQRVHRWAGVTYTGACLDRPIGSPYFDLRFLRMCHALPPTVKVGSGFAARTLEVLDPRLANLSLASGLRPAQFPRWLATHTTRGAMSAIVRKAMQQVRTVSHPPAGADALADLTVQHWRANPELLTYAESSGFVDGGWLDGLLAGRHSAGMAAVGFLANLEVAGSVATR
jgi:asparagine synthase (glutamine-hydrolysing)